jgi:hypothetical protein
MALVLIKETGAGLSDANSYASVADADSYHEGHLYGSAWTTASTSTKEAALVMATRLIDGCHQFNGRKVSSTQGLQWPRAKAIDPDGAGSTGLFSGTGFFFAEDVVPIAVVNATCELARELIKADSTDATDAEGLQSISIAGALTMQFDKKDQQAKIPETARVFLAKLGTYLPGTSGTVRLVRV